jgi:hypothetical protein
MKRVYDMEESELLALTDEQVLIMIDYECALEGIPMLPPAPGAKPVREMAKPDAQVFEIGGFFTRDHEHAIRILAAYNSGQLYREKYPNGDYNTRYLEIIANDRHDTPKIETKTVYSPETWDKIKNSHAEHAGILATWNKVNDEYQKALKNRQKITESVYAVIGDARDKSYDRNRFREEFKRYLILAEGNKQIALNFLEKVKDLSAFPELKEEFLKEEVKIEEAL